MSKRSCRELSIDIARDVINKNEIMIFTCSTFVPKSSVGLGFTVIFDNLNQQYDI